MLRSPTCALPRTSSTSPCQPSVRASELGRPAGTSRSSAGTSTAASAALRRSKSVPRWAALDALGIQGAGVLVVARRDRIARDVVLAGEIEREVARAGARLVSATGEGNGDSPADAFLRTVIDGAAQDERALIRARTRASLAAKRARRELVGAIPYGFALRGDGMHLVAARQEQATIARARGLRARGLSLRAVAAKLGFRGTRQPSRTPVSASADRAHVGRSERARIAERPIRGFLTIPRRTLQIQVVRDLERSFPERHQCVIHRVAPAPLSLAPKNMIPIHHLSPSWHHAFILPSVFDSGSLVSRCSRRRLRGSNRGRRGDAGERGRYTREDGPEAIPKAIPKAAGKHVVIGSGSGR